MVWVSEIHFIDFFRTIFSGTSPGINVSRVVAGWFPGGPENGVTNRPHNEKEWVSNCAGKKRVSPISQFVIRDPSFFFAFRDPRFFGFSGFPVLHLLAPPWFCKTSGALKLGLLASLA